MSTENDPMMTRKEAARFLGLQPSTLDAWAARRTVNLPFSKLGGAVRYRKSDLEKFIKMNRVG
jgi:excisionase family DNA binding protein